MCRMQYKGAIFDMDGVLFDTERIYQETWQEIAALQDITLDGSFLRAISGTNGAHMCRVIKYVKNEKCTLKDLEYGEIREILDYFRKNDIGIAVASSSAVQQIEANLQMSGIRDYFSVIVSGSEVNQGKPEPDIFLLAAKRLHCAPEECFVFEDSENGIRAGYAAGCFTVMVPDLLEASSEIQPYCRKICSDLEQAVREIIRM